MGQGSSSSAAAAASLGSAEQWLVQEYLRQKQQRALRAADGGAVPGAAQAPTAGAATSAEAIARAGALGAHAEGSVPLQRMMVHSAMRELHEMIGELLAREVPGAEGASAPDDVTGASIALTKRHCDAGASQAEKRPRSEEGAHTLYGFSGGLGGGADVMMSAQVANGGVTAPPTQPGLLTAVATVSAQPGYPVRDACARHRARPLASPAPLPASRIVRAGDAAAGDELAARRDPRHVWRGSAAVRQRRQPAAHVGGVCLRRQPAGQPAGVLLRPTHPRSTSFDGHTGTDDVAGVDAVPVRVPAQCQLLRADCAGRRDVRG
jgi:hypothetical protein